MAHLVLGRPRPAPVLPPKPKGVSKQEWKSRKAALRVAGATLAPGIEEAVALKEAWSHKAQGTAETHQHLAVEAGQDNTGLLSDHARLHAEGRYSADDLAADFDWLEREAARSGRGGALARLHVTGAVDAHQLAAADEIRIAHASIVADVAVRTAKLEPRGSGGGPDAASAERIAAVIRERSYGEWREAVAPHAAMLLAIIVDDVALTAAARRWRLSNRRARAILVAALDRWRRR